MNNEIILCVKITGYHLFISFAEKATINMLSDEKSF